MFQLFKKRNFGELVGDTFSFFKKNGKHYFRNYFIINGGFLLLMLVLVYFMSKIFMDGAAANLNGAYGTGGNSFENYIFENLPLVVGAGIVGFIVIVFLSVLSYTYPVMYLKLSENSNDFSSRDIIKAMKANSGKIIAFILGSLFIMMPIMLAVGALCVFLAVFIIGIPMLIILIPALVCWSTLSFYDYLSTDNGYFESIGNGFVLLRTKFWPSVGSTMVMYLVTQLAVTVVTFIPYIIGMVSVFTSLDSNSANTDRFSFMMIMVVVAMVLSMLLSFVLQNLILVNQGIIYYSMREESENNSSKSEIDLIGVQGE